MSSFNLFDTGKIYVCTEPVSWRYRIKGLDMFARSKLNLDLRNTKAWLIVFNKQRNSLRALHYDSRTIVLYERKLLENKYIQILQKDMLQELSKEQLLMLFKSSSKGIAIST